ncbi:hypothetical protein M409DRAFT_68384 [Zasmidium cellare ATCC 36951]|uniref:Uncharacterized protein n=1 Tax=Zasmidium cellare ATCC 36951 TaxID=1080233 RepID=A0A6A6CB41_ZASCE|nr:uncharacterized protein M409DRAFT_68384 [Zasmidium cellare ATCC 36951]KAF2163420.1 hypothetical protein M409DRAFT_68384 [Zasmidium cellare ATCC 36951]
MLSIFLLLTTLLTASTLTVAQYVLRINCGRNCVNVSVIDSTAKLAAPMKHMVQPPIKGHDTLECPSFSFLIQHPTGRRPLFDLGTRKDWRKFPPSVRGLLEQYSFGIEVDKNVNEILEDHGIDVAGGAFEAIIWSHWRYDHIGDVSAFPSSTALVVGPGFVETFTPGYPSRADAFVLESDYEGRHLHELSFDSDSQLIIGGYRAEHYFGDGSFYFLDTPGHAIGHVCGLARVAPDTTEENSTFVFMGGDACHHGGEFRPSQYLPLPKAISFPKSRGISTTCLGEFLVELHRRDSAVTPFYEMAESAVHDRAEARQAISNMQAFDADSNVSVVISHDATLFEMGMNVFPDTLNAWKQEDYARRGRWIFLSDFCSSPRLLAGKPRRLTCHM